MSIVRTAETSIELGGLFDMREGVIGHTVGDDHAEGSARIVVSSPCDTRTGPTVSETSVAHIDVVMACDLDDESDDAPRAVFVADVPWPELVAFARTIVAMP